MVSASRHDDLFHGLPLFLRDGRLSDDGIALWARRMQSLNGQQLTIHSTPQKLSMSTSCVIL
jgi:hypothetical protein